MKGDFPRDTKRRSGFGLGITVGENGVADHPTILLFLQTRSEMNYQVGLMTGAWWNLKPQAALLSTQGLLSIYLIVLKDAARPSCHLEHKNEVYV